jgi:Pectate lyase superfamily protein
VTQTGGTPLNAHLAQLQNPTNGGINSFDQFSQRPTTLTADDVGKTYLYTQTGNIHQWTGTAWKVLNESVINVKDYGAIGDGVTDDSVVVQAFLDSTTIDKNKSLFFPEGRYLLNISLRYYVPNIIGQGNHSTILSSFTPTGFAITVNRNDTWLPFEISNLRIEGNSAKTKNGISFGNPNNGNTDEYAGGLRLISVEMSSLDVAILKRYGNIGNYFESCRFWNSNYHYKAYSLPTAPGNYGNHSGCDTFLKCEFESADKAAIFINGKNDGNNGQNIFRDCVFQYNKGFAFCIIDYVGVTRPNLVIENTWIEDNANTATLGLVDSAAIDIDGIMRIPRTFLFIESTATMQNTMITDIELVGSQVRATGAGLGQVSPLNIKKDSGSFLYLDQSNSPTDVDFITKNHLFKNTGGFSLFHTAPNRLNVSKSNENLLFSNSYSNDFKLNLTNNAGGLISTIGQSVKDGTLYDRCIELVYDSSNNTVVESFLEIASNIILPKGKFIFWSIDVKKMSGQDFPFRVNSGVLFSNPVYIKKNTWQTIVGLGDTLNITNPFQVGVNLLSYQLTSTFRIANFQILAFDTLQDMMEYSNSLQFRTKTENTISYNTIFPTTGTYNKGDLIYNTNPTPGGFIGWICITSGTPGTWKGFGSITA